jgi:uncharacterized membrane protein
MATGFVAALLIIAGLVPTTYNTTSGFTLERLRREQAQLLEQKAKLDAAEAQLVSMDRLEKLAKQFDMTRPEPTQVQILEGKAQNAEARNVLPAKDDGVAQ